VPIPSKCDDLNDCTIDTCANSVCSHVPITVGRCRCASQCAGPVNACELVDCVFPGSPFSCADILDQTIRDNCNTDLANINIQSFCYRRQKSCLRDACKDSKCIASTGACEYTPRPCLAGDKCLQSGVCDFSTDACVYPPKTGSALLAVCPNSDPCKLVSCESNTCSYTRLSEGSCALNPCARDPPCPALTDRCLVPLCVFSASDCDVNWAVGTAENIQCHFDIVNNVPERYCGALKKTCPSNVCEAQTCNSVSGDCEVTSTLPCPPPNACFESVCDVSKGGCVNTPRKCTLANKCVTPICVDFNGMPNCTEGPAIVCDDGRLCTSDRCDVLTGCVYTPVDCVVSECNATKGCFEAKNSFGYPPGCYNFVVSSLIDFCGVCNGDNVACFFNSVLPTSTVAGIAGGVAAAIAVACIVAAAIAFWLSKKGYDYYRAQSDINAAGLHSNPYYHDNGLQGSVPDFTARGGHGGHH
jgi:hypothetical protein